LDDDKDDAGVVAISFDAFEAASLSERFRANGSIDREISYSNTKRGRLTRIAPRKSDPLR
jgi:hypothetical protein